MMHPELRRYAWPRLRSFVDVKLRHIAVVCTVSMSGRIWAARRTSPPAQLQDLGKPCVKGMPRICSTCCVFV